MFLESLFGKKEKVVVETKSIADNLPMLYLNNLTRYTNYIAKKEGIKRPSDNEIFFNKCAEDYYKYANYFVEYIREKFPDTIFMRECNTLYINIEEMLADAPLEAKDLFLGPKYPKLIYIGSNTHSAHIHTYNSKIEEAENIECLPGLSDLLISPKINKLFNGLSICEGHALLKQMKILPKDSELSLIVKSYEEFDKVHLDFMNSIIYLLLLNKNKYSVLRTKFFADTFNIEFDFSSFEKNDEKVLRFQK